jgi:multidrug efflux pump subunit AcrA (membrane-fusion protein)
MNGKLMSVLVLAIILGGCGGFSHATPTPLPTVVLDSGGVLAPTSMAGTPEPSASSMVAASGVIIPAREAQISSALGGNVLSIEVVIGEQVKKDQLLVQLSGKEKATATLEAARMELISARVDLKTLKDGADQAYSAALVRLAAAKDELDDATKRLAWKDMKNGSRSAIEEAEANFILARVAFEEAEDKFSGYADGDANNIYRAGALSALAAARHKYDRALANLNYLIGMPDSIEVEKAEARYQAALAEVALAETETERLKDGPDPDALELAEGRVRNAEASVAASQADLTSLELRAPFAGSVGRIAVTDGEYVQPGGVVLVLINDARLRVRTTDLSERDVPGVAPGQAVSVFVKPLGRTIGGVVAEVSPLADTLGGDVVYKTIIDLDMEDVEGLRAGMSVNVTFE